MDQIRLRRYLLRPLPQRQLQLCPPWVKRLGNDIIGGKLFVRNQTGKSIGGSQLHLIIDIACSYVEGAAEYTGERKHIVDLVREITPAGRYDLCPAGLCVIRKDLGVGFAQAKTIASLAMVFTISVVTTPGAETPMNTSAPFSISARVPDCFFRFVTFAISSLTGFIPSYGLRK